MLTLRSPPPPSSIDRADRGLAASLDYDMLVRDIDVLPHSLASPDLESFD